MHTTSLVNQLNYPSNIFSPPNKKTPIESEYQSNAQGDRFLSNHEASTTMFQEAFKIRAS